VIHRSCTTIRGCAGLALFAALAACDAASDPSASDATRSVARAPRSERPSESSNRTDSRSADPAEVDPTRADSSSAEGFPLPSDAREGRSADATYLIRWAPVGGAISELEPFAIAVEVRRADGAALAADAGLFADAEMPHHGHGMNLVPTVTRASDDGASARFIASGLLLHMPGKWVFAIDVEESGILERTQWHVEIE
jgi:hypothetical protein